VSDAFENTVTLLTSQGYREATFQDSNFASPYGIDIDAQGNSFVVSRGTHMLFHLDQEAVILGSRAGFTDPISTAYDSTSKVLWIADSHHPAVWAVTEDLQTVLGLSEIPLHPLSVDIDNSSGRCWAADSARAGIFVFRDHSMAIDNSILGKYPGSHFILADHVTNGCWLLFGSSEHQLARFSSSAVELYSIGGLNNPRSMDFDPIENALWITDTNHNDIVKLDPEKGELLLRLEGFNLPSCISINPPEFH
jgi:streptogramin lyase